MDDVKIKVIDSDKLVTTIMEGSYDINLSAVMALGAVMMDTKKQDCKDAVRGYPIDADFLMAKVAEEYGERARDALYRIIRYMPPAQQEPQWIPVSEKLPERRKHYIVTDFGDVEEAYYTSDGHWFSVDGNKLKDVTAWMPMPSPYRAEGREDE